MTEKEEITPEKLARDAAATFASQRELIDRLMHHTKVLEAENRELFITLREELVRNINGARRAYRVAVSHVRGFILFTETIELQAPSPEHAALHALEVVRERLLPQVAEAEKVDLDTAREAIAAGALGVEVVSVEDVETGQIIPTVVDLTSKLKKAVADEEFTRKVCASLRAACAARFGEEATEAVQLAAARALSEAEGLKTFEKHPTWIREFIGKASGETKVQGERTYGASRIKKDYDVLGGSACIKGTRIAVWSLENCRRLGQNERQILETYPGLSPLDLEAAWTYAVLHREEIDEEIRDHEQD